MGGIFRIIIIVILFYLIYQVLKGFIRPQPTLKKKPGKMNNLKKTPETEELVQDPQCGIYFPRSEGVAEYVEGRVLYFHNKACRDKYLEARRPKTEGR